MILSFIRRPFKYRYTNVVLLLVGINCAVYIMTMMYPALKIILSLNPLYFWYQKMYWQPFTYMFMHAGFQHLLFNMLGLLFFGIPLERTVGSKEFTLMYVLFGVLSGCISLLLFTVSGSVYTFLMGASGAIYGILLAYSVAFPRSSIYIWGLVPVPAPLLIVIYAIIAFGSQLAGSSGIAHITHLSGFAVAWIYFIIRMGINPLKAWKNAYR